MGCAGSIRKEWSRGRELNPRPTDYEALRGLHAEYLQPPNCARLHLFPRHPTLSTTPILSVCGDKVVTREPPGGLFLW